GVAMEEAPMMRETLGQQEFDIAAAEIGDKLRAAFDDTDIVAYTGSGRFGAIGLYANADLAEQKLRRVWTELGQNASLRLAWTGARPGNGSSLHGLLDELEQSLCENGLVASSAGRHI